jgi:hypothetical protein
MATTGRCKFCLSPTEDENYVFCDMQCSEFHYLGVERKMKTDKVSLPEDLFKSWLENETNLIESMTAEQIQDRIIELEKIIFESKTRLSVTHQKRIKLQGADWAANSKSISAPDFRVSYDKDVRKRPTPSTVKATKEERQAQLQDAAGIDKDKLKKLIKEKMLAKAREAMAKGKA